MAPFFTEQLQSCTVICCHVYAHDDKPKFEIHSLFFPSISCEKYQFSFVHSNLCMCAVWCQASNVQAVFRAVLVKKGCLLWLKNYTMSLVRENYNK